MGTKQSSAGKQQLESLFKTYRVVTSILIANHFLACIDQFVRCTMFRLSSLWYLLKEFLKITNQRTGIWRMRWCLLNRCIELWFVSERGQNS